MTSQEHDPSAKQPELVAAGASVGAGCRPWVSHQDCGCGTHNDETQAAPVTATGGHAAGCSGMATRFASGDASRTMARCREMFARFMSAVSPAETDEAPAATTATGGCKKEA